MKLLNFKDLKNSSIYFTPNFPLLQTKRYKVPFFVVVGIFLLYSALILGVAILIISFTPLREYVVSLERSELKQQVQRIEKLESKIIFLTKELENISSINKKLKYALILGNQTTVDTNSAIYDSLKKNIKKPVRIGGNIFAGIIVFFNKLLQSNNEFKAGFYSPVRGVVIKKFNPEKAHVGIDFAAAVNSPVIASSGGLIIFADFTVKDGNTIIIQHENGYLTFYKHLSIILKKEREYVSAGETIALVGNTGYDTTGPHLHFEIWKDNKPINPLNVLINKEN
jgi:murein DD-endopeptidase MepM/ murein hydrolase activator NlpD